MISCDRKDISTLNVHHIPFSQYFENLEQEGVVASRESVIIREYCTKHACIRYRSHCLSI